MSALVVIDSRDCTPNQRLGEATYRLDANSRGFRSLELVEYELVLDVPHINENNNTAVFVTPTNSYPITIPIGSYTVDELAVALAAQLTTVIPGTWAVAYDPVTLHYTITAPVAFSIQFNPILIGSWDYTRMMGLLVDAPPVAIMTGGLVDLVYTKSVFICSRKAHERTRQRDLTSVGRAGDILGVVHLREDDEGAATQDFGKGIYQARIENPKRVRFDTDTALAELDIVILDDRGQPLPGDGTSISGAPPIMSYRIVMQST